MKDNSLLISVGVLQNYWESGKKDTLELLMPFFKSTLSKIAKVGELIDVEKLSQEFRKDYGYENMPIDVINTMLKRLSPEIVQKKNKTYYLVSSLDDEVAKFEKKRKNCKEHCVKVIDALKIHMEMNDIKMNDIELANELYSFFVQHGLCVAKDTEDLIGIQKKNNKASYEIADFIMKEYKKESIIFDYILEMVQGFFVSTALSINQASTSIDAKFRGLSCYIDTRIIIDALGYHLPKVVKESACEFIKMLKDSGAKVFCFEHNYNEIKNVLKAYKNSLANENYGTDTNTLEALDERQYISSDVERLISKLQIQIEELGIEIVKTPLCNLDAINKYLDVNKLEETLRNELVYKTTNNEAAIQSDLSSVKSIMLLRGGKVSDSLEKAEHVFISSNYKYCSLVSSFLQRYSYESVSAVYLEEEFASLLWLRNYSTHKNYPKRKLIENAMTVLEVPSQSFINDLFSVIEKIELEGGITNDEAAVIRGDYYCKKELLKESRGDAFELSSSNITAIRNKLRDKYVSEEAEKGKLNYQKYQEQCNINKELKSKARNKIILEGEKKYNSIKKGLSITIRVVFAVIFIVGIYSIIKCLLEGEINYFMCFVCVIDILGYCSQIKDQHSFMQKQISKFAKNESDKLMDKKREEFASIFGENEEII